MFPPVLLLHGAPGDARVWSPVIDCLAPETDLRAITLRYFGKAAWPDDGRGFGTETHCEDIVAYIETTMEPPVALVAWSYAVHPALLAAIRRPDLFAALFLYEPGLTTYVDDPAALGRFAEDAAAAFGSIAQALGERGPEAAVASLIDMSGGEGCFAAMAEERRQIYLGSAAMMPLLMGGGAPPAAIAATDLARVAIPATVGLGECSRPVFGIPSRALAEALPQGRLLVVPEADHLLPEKDPERFAAVLKDWLFQPKEQN